MHDGSICGGKMQGHLVSKQSSSQTCTVAAFVAANCKDRIEQNLVVCLAACGQKDKAKQAAVNLDIRSISLELI